MWKYFPHTFLFWKSNIFFRGCSREQNFECYGSREVMSRQCAPAPFRFLSARFLPRPSNRNRGGKNSAGSSRRNTHNSGAVCQKTVLFFVFALLMLEYFMSVFQLHKWTLFKLKLGWDWTEIRVFSLIELNAYFSGRLVRVCKIYPPLVICWFCNTAERAFLFSNMKLFIPYI